MQIPKSLKDRLLKGQVVPFVGAGVSMSVLDRSSGKPLFPSWRELLNGAADCLEQEGKAPAAEVVRSLLKLTPPDFLEAAERAQKALGPLWYDFLKAKIDIPFKNVDPASLELARTIWRLGSPLVITTNYDEVLRWACPHQDLQSWDIEAPVEQAALLQQRLERPVIWHLHGRISNSSELILSSDGYRVLYSENDGAEGKRKYDAALNTLRHQLASKTFLFVGFSLDDEYFEMQLKSIQEMYKGAIGPHYAVVLEQHAGRVRQLEIEPLTVPAFGDPLLALLAEFGSAVTPTAPPTSSTTHTNGSGSRRSAEPADSPRQKESAVHVDHETWPKAVLRFFTLGTKEWIRALLNQPTQPPFGHDQSFDHELGRSARLFVMVMIVSGLLLAGTNLFRNVNFSLTISDTLWAFVIAILISLIYKPVASLMGIRICPLDRVSGDSSQGKPLSVQQIAFTFFYIIVPWLPIFAFIRANFLGTPVGILKDFLLIAPVICLIYIIVNFTKAIRLITNSSRTRIWLSVALPLLLFILYDAFK